ncbi:hypothetical protein [Methanoregula sp. UBA64]|jgi:hypothetical protein|uniref:hypothetical protein n=1 Tax=Methanoregula sp. UBA64 TaxID=1915554 RepID=UPI0025F3EE97|nr:hypothetical protein [Methanoregula sp. UBA64]
MEKKRVREILMGILSTYMALFLFLDVLMFSFAFLINWEAWFFGIKLDGWPAGLYLAATALAATGLIVLLLKYPGRSFAICSAAVLYFAFVYILPVFSRQANMKSDLGWTVFWAELVLYIVIPLVFLGVAAVLGRTKTGESA